MNAATGPRRLVKFYEQMSSLDTILGYLAAEGLDTDPLQASDVYTRGLDCQNLGTFSMLGVLADVVAEYGAPGPEDRLLDIGCGLGGPGRFLADRFGCSVVGTDLLANRIDIAKTLTRKTGLAKRISYRVADATDLPFADRAFSHAWMLDVSMHIRAKAALFREIARVLRPGGLLVMHEQTAPIPDVMRPVTRQAPYIAPSLPRLVRYVDDAGLRVLAWRDTTPRVREYFEGIRAALEKTPLPPRGAPGRAIRERGRAVVDGYIEALANFGGRTGILAAIRTGAGPRRSQRRRRAH